MQAAIQGLKLSDDWLNKAQQRWDRVHDMRYRLMIDNPGIVRFNEDSLPKPPKEVVVETDPSSAELQVEANKIDGEKFKPVDRREVKMHNWLHSFVGSLHGTQAYISNNWYQGGENNLNLLAEFDIGGKPPLDFEIVAELSHEVVNIIHFFHHQR